MLKTAFTTVLVLTLFAVPYGLINLKMNETASLESTTQAEVVPDGSFWGQAWRPHVWLNAFGVPRS